MECIITKQTLKAEQKLKSAMLSSDTEQLAKLLADNLVFINHQGLRLSNQDDLDLHASGLLCIKSTMLEDLNIMTMGDMAIGHVNADITGEYDGQNANGQFAFKRVWTKKQLDGQVISAQSTLCP
ncbi:cytochrome P450 [Pseudoalteromonas luteoviolacea]|nr:cytochrome P450 [Pseudoalteromonas luteoviolacea]